MAGINDIVTRGYGSFSTVNKLPTRGYTPSAVVVEPTPRLIDVEITTANVVNLKVSDRSRE